MGKKSRFVVLAELGQEDSWEQESQELKLKIQVVPKPDRKSSAGIKN